jgi:general secretion pathway protein H
MEAPTVFMPMPETMTPISQFAHSMIDVHRKMVELPDKEDSWLIAKLSTDARMAKLINEKAIAKMNELEMKQEALVSRYEAELVKQQKSLDDILFKLRHLQPTLEQAGAHVSQFAHDPFDFKNDDEPHILEKLRRGETDVISHSAEEEPPTASATGDGITGGLANARSRVSALSEPSSKFAALQIARKLHEVRENALRSRQEQAITIDVERGILREEDSGGEFVQLHPTIELRLDTARSEIIDESKGRIRFFPDGSSTGGRIQLQHDGDSATVNVTWSTGAATVEVKDD